MWTKWYLQLIFFQIMILHVRGFHNGELNIHKRFIYFMFAMFLFCIFVMFVITSCHRKNKSFLNFFFLVESSSDSVHTSSLNLWSQWLCWSQNWRRVNFFSEINKTSIENQFSTNVETFILVYCRFNFFHSWLWYNEPPWSLEVECLQGWTETSF